MFLIQQITDAARQKQELILADGTKFLLAIEFKPMQLGWFITELTYGDFTLKGMRICTLPNLLQQYRNLLPFGLACFTTDNGEPKLQEDFSSAYAKLYVLSAEEVDEIMDLLNG